MEQSKTTNAMTDEDRAVVVAFAAGDKSKRDAAIAIHRKWIPVIGCRDTPEQDFMAEVDNPCPDLILRARYRATLLVGSTPH